jgi:hypothetical protein
MKQSLRVPRHFFVSPAFVVWLALVVSLCALGWRWLSGASDAGPIAEWLPQLKTVYAPTVFSAASSEPGVLTDGEWASRIWKKIWVAANGHWDAQVLSFASIVIHAVAWACSIAFVLPALKRKWQIVVMLGIAAVALMVPATGDFFKSEATAWSGWLLLLSVLHLHGQLSARLNTPVWWLGAAAGLFNALGAAEGCGSALALAVVGIWGLLKRKDDQRTHRWRAIINGAIVLVSAWLMAVRSHAGTNVGKAFGARLSEVYSWPLEYPWALLALSLPAVWWLVGSWRQQDERGGFNFLEGLAVWSLLQPLIVAAVGTHLGAAAGGVVITGLLINAACVLAIIQRNGLTRAVAAASTFWAFAAVHLLLQVQPDLDRVYERDARERQALVAWREGNADGLATALRVDAREARTALEGKSSVTLQNVLPASLRTPLAAPLSSQAEEGVFRLTGVPELLGEAAGWPAWGTWSAQGVRGAGRFESALATAAEPLIRVWIAGAHNPASVSIRLRTEDGREIDAFAMPVSESTRWVRLNFANPGVPFRLIAEARDERGWLAVSGPVAVGGLSWVSPKAIDSWAWFLSGAVVLLGVGFWRLKTSAEEARPADQASVSAPEASLRLLPWLILIGYAFVAAQEVSTAAGGADSAGYLNTARLFSEGKLTMPLRTVPGVSAQEFGSEIYMPMPFRFTARQGEIAPVTAIGLPFMYAAAGSVMPLPLAVAFVIVLNAVLAVLFTRWAAAAFGLSWGWAWIAGFGVGLSPLSLFIGLQPLSDGASMTWVTGAIYFAWRSREKAGFAWLAGAATALAVLIRSPNVLCAVPIAICLWGNWRRCLFWILGGMPGAVFQMWHSWRVWGGPFESGYENVVNVLSLSYLPGNLSHYAFWIPCLLTPVALLVPGLPFARGVPLHVRWVLASWMGVFLGFYGIFLFTNTAWWFLRFILPACPALFIAGLLCARELARRLHKAAVNTRRIRISFAVAIFAWLIFVVVERQVFFWLGRDQGFIQVAQWLKRNAAPDSAVLAVHGAGTVTYYTDMPVIFYNERVLASPAFARALADSGQDVFAYMYHFERPNARPDFLGEWENVAVFQEGEIKLWKWRGLEVRGQNGAAAH